jgi:hypothetical protein
MAASMTFFSGSRGLLLRFVPPGFLAVAMLAPFPVMECQTEELGGHHSTDK